MSLLGDIGNNLGGSTGKNIGNFVNDWYNPIQMASNFGSFLDPGKQARETVAAIDKGQAGMTDAWKKSVSSQKTTASTSAFTPQELAIQKAMAANTAQLLADSQQRAAEFAAQPKFIYRDTNAAWQQAQNTAATSVNPHYTDLMNGFLTQQANALSQTQAETTANKTASDTTLGQTQQDIGTNQVRTAEDTATAIAQNQAKEGSWQTTEGANNTAAEDAARLAMGDQGIMGRGAGNLDTAKMARNLTSSDQTKAFQAERDTTNLLKTRTFADLETKGARAVSFNTTEKANLDRQLTDFITNQGTALEEKKQTNETARLQELYSATQGQYTTDTAKWIASLADQGYRTQDIGLAQSNYGGR